MRIVELLAYHIRIPLKRPIRHASHTRTDTDNLLIQCKLEDGAIGFGEGVPRDYVTGETIDFDMELLRGSALTEQFTDCTSFGHAARMAENLRLKTVPGDDRSCRGNAARCAVELAVLDAYGRSFGKPLSALTGILAPDLFDSRPRVRYSGAITSARNFKLLLAVTAMRLYGFHQMKVKVGIEGYHDAERLRRIRRVLGPAVDIRIDANEAWNPDEVIAKVRELELYGISSVEQPVPHGRVNRLTGIRKELNIPFMLDESLCGMVDAERAVAEETCDLFNIRLSKCGGFIPSLRLAQFARQRGLGYQLGCQVGESAVLSAAGRHFASSVLDIRYLEGSYDRHLVRESLGTKDLTFQRGGWAPALTSPGLGIELDRDAISRITIRKEQILG